MSYVIAAKKSFTFNLQFTSAFDPTAFIAALEQAVDELIPLRKDVAQQTQHAEKQVEAAERQYSAKVKELRDNFNVCLSFSFDAFLSAEPKVASFDRLSTTASRTWRRA